MAERDVAVVGIGMTRFGKYLDSSLRTLAAEAIDAALADAGLRKSDVQSAFVANAMASVITGEVSVVGQNVLRAASFSGIPVFNIDNACAGSSSAMALGVQAIRARAADTVLVVGVEKMHSADRARTYTALNGAADQEFVARSGIDPAKESFFVAAIYPPRLREYAERHGLSREILAQIAVKNRRHAAKNAFAQYTEPLTVEQVLASRTVVEPITALMCAPISDGAAAIVLTRKGRVAAHQRPVWVAACEVGMGAPPGAKSSIRRVAERAYSSAALAAADMHVAEVHDSIAFNELQAYEELGFCDPGEGARMVAAGDTSLGGRLPVNPSGGLESRGHPVAATGLAQIIELATQLRDEAGERQVPGARYAIAENAGGFARDDTAAIAVTILER